MSPSLLGRMRPIRTGSGTVAGLNDFATLNTLGQSVVSG